MRWIAAAASVVLAGFAVEARAETGAPVEIACAAASRADLEAGRPVRCDVALDLRGEPVGLRAEPDVVQVPRHPTPGKKNALPQIVEPAAPKVLGVWSGTVLLQSHASAPACNRIDAGDAVFPKGALKVRRGALPVVDEPAPTACPEFG